MLAYEFPPLRAVFLFQAEVSCRQMKFDAAICTGKINFIWLLAAVEQVVSAAAYNSAQGIESGMVFGQNPAGHSYLQLNRSPFSKSSRQGCACATVISNAQSSTIHCFIRRILLSCWGIVSVFCTLRRSTGTPVRIRRPL